MLLHVLRHVNLYEGILFAEDEIRQGLGKKRLPYAGRPEEDKRTHGAARILEPGTRATYRLGD